MNIRLYITLLFILLTSIPTIFVALVALSKAEEEGIAQAVARIDSLASVEEVGFRIFYEGQVNRLRAFSSRTKLRASLEQYNASPDPTLANTVLDILEDAREPFPDIVWVEILDLTGNVVAKTQTLTEQKHQKIRDALPEARQHEVLFFDERLDNLVIMGPIRRDGALLGVLVMGFTTDVLLSLVTDYRALGKTGEVLLAQRDEFGNAQFLHQRRFEDDARARPTVEQGAIEIPIVQALLHNERIFQDTVDYRNEPVIAATRFIDEMNWGLVVKIDRKELLESFDDFQSTIVILSILTALFTGIIAYIVATSLARPLEVLKKQAENVSRGIFSLDVPSEILNEPNEIGALATTLKRMTRELGDLYRSLEDKVKARTVELSREKSVSEFERRKLQVLLDNLPVGVFIARAPDGEPELVNKKGVEILGKGVDPKANEGNYQEVYQAVKENGAPYPSAELPVPLTLRTKKLVIKNDMYIKRPDKTVAVRATSVPLYDEKNNIVSVIAVFEDVSKDREIDKAKTEFVSLASHQLRTPLSTINWYVEMLLAGDAGTLSTDQKQYLEQVYESNQRMVELVNALLNVSRIELGTFAVEPELINPVEIAESAIKEQKPQADKKQIHITTTCEKAPVEYKADPKLFRMIVQNLLSNAIKYTPENGTVSVAIEACTRGHLWGEKKVRRDSLCLSVTDSGYGIPLDQQDKIFNKLFRADNVKELDAEGTGLGLYIIKAITKHSGGTIWFVSAENKGTTFYVTLPLKGMSKKAGEKSLSTQA